MSIPRPIVLLDARARYVHPASQMTRASTKTVFDSAGRLVTVPADALGWDHDPATGESRGYLAEPSATNRLLHSNDLNNSAWTRDDVTIGSPISGPDGAPLAKVIEGVSMGNHGVRQDFAVADGEAVTASAVVAAGERNSVSFFIQNPDAISNNAQIVVSLADGSVVSTNASGDGEHIDSGCYDLGGGLYRMWLSGRVGPGITAARINVRLRNDAGFVYEGDGASGLYLGFLGAEHGSRPTSYIPTEGATASRAPDGLRCPAQAGWWHSERGTLLVEFVRPKARSGAARYVSGLGPTGISLIISSSGLLYVGGSYGDSNINFVDLFDAAGDRFVAALSWDEVQIVGALNGAIQGSANVVGSLSAVNSVGLGNNFDALAGSQLDGHVRRAVYYPQRLSNADLQSLTAIQE